MVKGVSSKLITLKYPLFVYFHEVDVTSVVKVNEILSSEVQTTSL